MKDFNKSREIENNALEDFADSFVNVFVWFASNPLETMLLIVLSCIIQWILM